MNNILKAIQEAEAYADLIENLRDVSAGRGLLNLFGYATGSLDAADPKYSLKALQNDQAEGITKSQLHDALNDFAASSILFNIRSKATDLLTVCEVVLKNTEGRPNLEVSRSPSPAVLDAAEIAESEFNRNRNGVVAKDSMESLRMALAIDATVAPSPETSSVNVDKARLLKLCAFLREVLDTSLSGFSEHGLHGYTSYHLPALRCAAALMSLIKGVSLDSLRQDRLAALQTQATHETMISDLTLAALPVPTKELMTLCEHDREGRLSTTGMLYVQTCAAYQ